MSAHTLRKLVIALVLGLVVWGGLTLSSGGGKADEGGAVASVLEGVTPLEVSGVRIVRGSDTVALRRNGARWTVNGWPADSAAVANLLQTVAGVHVGDLVASNPANHGRMNLAGGSAWTVTFDLGGDEHTLLVGKDGPRSGTAYVRVPEDDDVYLLEGDLRGSVNRPVEEWRSKWVAAVDTGVVQRVEITRGGTSLGLVRTADGWTLDDGAEADPTVVKNLLSELSGFRADAFLAEDDSVARLPQAVAITALGPSDDTLAAVRMGSGSTDRWARARGDSVLYRIGGWRADRLAPEHLAQGGGVP